MHIAEMHVLFRQFAQQMGMQNVRAILPEQIDLLINTSITDTFNQIVTQNIGLTNDRVVTDNSKIGQINALRTLYKVKEIPVFYDNVEDSNKGFTFKPSHRKIGKISYDLNKFKELIGNDDFKNSCAYYVDFSLNYIKPSVVNFRHGVAGFYFFRIKPNEGTDVAEGVDLSTKEYQPIVKYDTKDSLETNYFPVRLIDDAYLADSLNDFVLKNRLRSPICVIYNDTIDLYIDEFTNSDECTSELTSPDCRGIMYTTYYHLKQNLVPYIFRISYIANPAKVKYVEDLSGNADDNVDCDFPDYMHEDIVKHAVDLYRIAVSGSLHAAAQQDQNQAQENMRNNYRNDGNTTRQQQVQ